MATGTKNPKLNDHGEEEKKPLFGPGSGREENPSSFDPQKTPIQDPNIPGIGTDTIADRERNTASNRTPAEAREIDKLEGTAKAEFGSASKNSTNPEADTANNSWKYTPDKNKKSFRARVTTKRNGWIVAGFTVAFGSVAGFSLIQGPLQFVHLSQNLQKMLSVNEDFGNDRTSKALLYALAGKGFENTRLGVIGNGIANQWEKKLIRDTGLKPVYRDPGRKFAGFEVVDEKKAAATLEDLGLDEDGNRNAKKANESLHSNPDNPSQNAHLTTADDMKDAKGKNIKVSPGKGQLTPGNRILNLAGLSSADRRAWIKVVGRATSVHNVVGSQASRLLIKRAGVKFHVLEKLRDKKDDKSSSTIAQLREKWRELRNKDISEGAKSINGVSAGASDTDGDGKTDTVKDSDIDASKESQDLIKRFRAGTFKAGAGVALAGVGVVGIFCAVKSYGDSLPDYKFKNIAKPMMRIGAEATSIGDQTKSFDDFDLGVMGEAVDFLHDKENNTSFNQAEAYQDAAGKDGGIPPPGEMELRNINDKPKTFNIIDSIPGLDTACAIQEGIFGLPIIRNVLAVTDSITSFIVGGALSVAGTSEEELLNASLKIVAGQSVDPETTVGAAYGNAAFIGTNLAANDTAIAMGGDTLTKEESTELGLYQQELEKEDVKEQSVFARYIDPINSDSLTASLIDNSPSSSSEAVAIILNPLQQIASIFQNSLSFLVPKTQAQAATLSKNYGFENYGYSIADRNNTKYEDPYENAEIVEQYIDELNEKYGACFGIKIISDGQTISIENGESVNIFKFKENGGDGVDGCDKPAKGSAGYELYERYRFYIADAITLKSLECFGEPTCYSPDFGSQNIDDTASGEAGSTGTGAIPTGTAVELAQKLLDYKKEGKYNCDNAMDCEDLEFTVQGKSIKGGVGCVADKLDIKVLQLMVYLIENGNSIGTYALCRSHSYNAGAHPQGAGLDISSINGKSLNSTASRADALKVSGIIFNLSGDLAPRQIIIGGVGATRQVSPDFVKFNRVEKGIEGQAAVNAFGPGTMAGHTDHIHVGYPY